MDQNDPMAGGVGGRSAPPMSPNFGPEEKSGDLEAGLPGEEMGAGGAGLPVEGGVGEAVLPPEGGAGEAGLPPEGERGQSERPEKKNSLKGNPPFV